MGPSGSGKTTLLDVLAGRKTQGETRGEVQFAGVRPTVEFLRRFTGYVEQFGERHPSVHAAFASACTFGVPRLPRDAPSARRLRCRIPVLVVVEPGQTMHVCVGVRYQPCIPCQRVRHERPIVDSS